MERRFLPQHPRQQGNTPTCSFHAATVGLEFLLRNDPQYSHEIKSDLSVLDTAFRYGYCEQHSSQELPYVDSIVPLLLKIREDRMIAETIAPNETFHRAAYLNRSLKNHLSQCKSRDHQNCEEPFSDLHMDIERVDEAEFRQAPLKFITKKARQENLKEIPPFSVRTWDQFTTKDELLTSLITEFKLSSPKRPFLLSTCFDDRNTEICMESHAIALTGFETIRCTSRTTPPEEKLLHKGTFINSWEDRDYVYDLDLMTEGMTKAGGFYALEPCNKDSCEPISRTPHSFPLYHFAELGNIDLVKKELSLHPERINDHIRSGITPLSVATLARRLEVAEELIKHGANPNIGDNQGTTPLMNAALNGDFEFTQFLLSKGAKVNLINSAGESALHHAARSGNSDIVRLLIEKGERTHLTRSRFESPLHLAARSGFADMVRFLISKGAKPNSQDTLEMTPLGYAAQNGHLQVARSLIRSGVDPNSTNRSRKTPLYIAVQNGYFDFVKFLLDQGANLNLRTETRASPLHEAADKGYVDILRLLLSRGADPNSKDRDDWTPLHVAAAAGELNIVKELLAAQADPKLKNSEGRTPLKVALLNRRQNVVQFLQSLK